MKTMQVNAHCLQPFLTIYFKKSKLSKDNKYKFSSNYKLQIDYEVMI